MVNNEIRLIIFFAAKDGEALYSQQKQDQELTVAQIMNSLLPDIVQETGIKTIPKKKNEKSKMAVWEALQTAVKRREEKSNGEKERYKHLIKMRSRYKYLI